MNISENLKNHFTEMIKSKIELIEHCYKSNHHIVSDIFGITNNGMNGITLDAIKRFSNLHQVTKLHMRKVDTYRNKFLYSFDMSINDLAEKKQILSKIIDDCFYDAFLWFKENYSQYESFSSYSLFLDKLSKNKDITPPAKHEIFKGWMQKQDEDIVKTFETKLMAHTYNCLTEKIEEICKDYNASFTGRITVNYKNEEASNGFNFFEGSKSAAYHKGQVQFLSEEI